MKKLPIVSLAIVMCSVAMLPMMARSSPTNDYYIFGDLSAGYSPQPSTVVVALHNVRTNETLYEFTDTGGYSMNLADLGSGFAMGDQLEIGAVDNNAYGGIGRDSTTTSVVQGITERRVDLMLVKDPLPFGELDDTLPSDPSEIGEPVSGDEPQMGPSCQPPPGDWIITGYVECQNENIIVFQGDLIIRSTGHLRFWNDVNLYMDSDPSERHGITIEREGSQRGLFEVWSNSLIEPATRERYSYFFDVYGELEVSGSTVSYVYGEIATGGIHFHGGSIGRILPGSRVWRGDTHGIYADGRSEAVTLTIQDSTIDENGFSTSLRAGNGIYLRSVDATISENDILDNEYYGICLRDGSSPSIVDNTISGNVYGIRSISSSPTIDDNIITSNPVGIYISGGFPPSVTGNDVTWSTYYGIYVTSSSPLIEGNTLSNNYRGIRVNGHTSQIRGNTIYGTVSANRRDYSLYVYWSSSVVDDNTVQGGSYGVQVLYDYWGNPPTVVDNTIWNAIWGLHLFRSDANVWSSSPSAPYDQHFRSNVHNILIEECSPVVRWNRIDSLWTGGIPISHEGIHVYDLSSPTINNNQIGNQRYFGITFDNQTSGMVSSNYIYAWFWQFMTGVHVYDSTVEIYGNNIRAVYRDIYTEGASATIDNNYLGAFWWPELYGIVSYGSTPLNTITRNTITNHREVAISEENSASHIEDNTITNNWRGIELLDSSSVITNGNDVISNQEYGIYVNTPGLQPEITDNTINSNEYGIYLEGTNTAPDIAGNTISSNTRDGLISVYASPVIGSPTNPNTFELNGGWGIHSQFAEPQNAGILGAGLEADNVFGRGSQANLVGDCVQEWNVRVYVTHGGWPVGGADVTVWQENQYPPGGDPVWSGQTEPDGYTPWISDPYLKEYEWDNTGTLHERDDHLFLAVKMPEGWTDSDIEKVDHDQITVHLEID